MSQAELDCFCERVAMGWPVERAAESIGRSRQSLYALRTRRKRFRQDWADAEQAVGLREEQFFTTLHELGFPALAAMEAGLTMGHVYHRLRTDRAFRERCDSAKAKRISELWRQVMKGAENDVGMRWKVLQAMAPDLFR